MKLLSKNFSKDGEGSVRMVAEECECLEELHFVCVSRPSACAEDTLPRRECGTRMVVEGLC